MPSIKIYPPSRLPDSGVSETQYHMWQEELEVYLESEDKFDQFMPTGRYCTWLSAEEDAKRILQAKQPDKDTDLPAIRKSLRQFITLVAKYVHIDYYQPIVRHSTSLQWIYDKIRQDYDIQQQGIHFFNILNITWDPTGQVTPIGLYNNYRGIIIGNLAKKHDKIEWKNETMNQDEKLTPSHEDLILLEVLRILHPKLPFYVRDQYMHKMGKNKRLMDFKTEILTKAKQYIKELSEPEEL